MEALQNELVLDTVFSFLGVTELKTVRSVCSTWKRVATPRFFAQTCVTLFLYDILPFITTANKFPSLKNVTNYRFHSIILTDQNIETYIQITQFFEEFGKSMVWFRMKDCILDKTGQFWTNLVRTSKWTPRLTELILDKNIYIGNSTMNDIWESSSRHNISTLRIYSGKNISTLQIPSGRSIEDMPFVLNKIWKEFPFLERLQLVGLLEEEYSVFLESTNPGKEKKSNPQLYLRDLNIFGEKHFFIPKIPHNQLELLGKMNLPLVKLTIDIGKEILPADLQKLFLVYGQTLKEITIWQDCEANKMEAPGFPYGINFPVLEFLQVSETCLINFNFIHQMPSLWKLNICKCEDVHENPEETELFNFRYSFKDWKSFIQNPHKVLTKLRIEFEINDESIEFLRGIFPNLCVLDAFINQEFQVITF